MDSKKKNTNNTNYSFFFLYYIFLQHRYWYSTILTLFLVGSVCSFPAAQCVTESGWESMRCLWGASWQPRLSTCWWGCLESLVCLCKLFIMMYRLCCCSCCWASYLFCKGRLHYLGRGAETTQRVRTRATTRLQTETSWTGLDLLLADKDFNSQREKKKDDFLFSLSV